MSNDINQALKETLKAEGLEHLEALNSLFGYEPPSGGGEESYWIVLAKLDSDNSAVISSKYDGIKIGDVVLLFDSDSKTCSGSSKAISINKANEQIKIVLTDEVAFDTSVSFDTIKINSIISNECKKIIADLEMSRND